MGISKVTPKTVKWYLESELKIKLVEEYKFCPTRKWKSDLAHLESHTLVEIEGGVYNDGRHNRATGYLKDIEKYNTATSMGFKVLRIGTGQSLSDFAEIVKKTINLQKT